MGKPEAEELLPGDLCELIKELASEDTVGIALLGSHARGEAGRYSDIDLVRFVTKLAEKEQQRLILKYRGEKLVSVSTTTTVAAKRRELTDPAKAIWVVPGLRQAKVLFDRDGSLAALIKEVLVFSWEPLQQAADEYASYELMRLVEEVHKILGAMVKGDESAAMYAILGMALGLTEVVAVQRGLLIVSENSYFQQVEESMGLDSIWTRYHRLALGFELGPLDRSPIEVKALASLRLYEETAGLLWPIVRPAHREVVEKGLAAIQADEQIAQSQLLGQP